jgi:hypothetical protein
MLVAAVSHEMNGAMLPPVGETKWSAANEELKQKSKPMNRTLLFLKLLIVHALPVNLART